METEIFFLGLLTFQKENARSPTKPDATSLIETKEKYLKSIGITDPDRLADNLLAELANSYHAEIISIAAIVGGILSQDIIRALARNEMTIDNYYHFNAKDGMFCFYFSSRFSDFINL